MQQLKNFCQKALKKFKKGINKMNKNVNDLIDFKKEISSKMTFKEKVAFKLREKTTWTAIALFGYAVFMQDWATVTTQFITLVTGN